MGVQLALDVGKLDEPGQLGLELAAVLAQLGWNPRQIEGGVDLLLGAGRDRRALRRAAVGGEEPVLVEPQLLLDRPCAHRDVVLLRAREVQERCPE